MNDNLLVAFLSLVSGAVLGLVFYLQLKQNGQLARGKLLAITLSLGVGGVFAIIRMDWAYSLTDWFLGVLAVILGLALVFARFQPNAVNMTGDANLKSLDGQKVVPTSPDDVKFASEYFQSASVFGYMVGATAGDVRAWAAGKRPVSRKSAERVARLALHARRQTALDASGLPKCEWMAAAWPDGAKGPVVSDSEFDAHVASCPTCMTRREFLDSLAPTLGR